MSLPAVIHHRLEAASQKVAGVSVLDRLIVALHRAGCSQITVVIEDSRAVPDCPRSRAWNVPFAILKLSELPEAKGPFLAAESHLLVEASDVRRVMEKPGRLTASNGILLPLGVVSGLGKNGSFRWDNARLVSARGVSLPVMDRSSCQAATRALWRSLTSSADGFIDKWFNRPMGRWLSKILIHTSVSPNQVSVLATLIGLWAAWLFAGGHSRWALWGALVLQLSAIIDCVDGDLARVLFKESSLGKWLDIIGDQVVHISVFVCIGIGLWRAGSEAPVLVMAVSSGVGVVISFLVVLRGLRQPAGRDSRLQRFIDATTNRDFSVLLIALAWAGWLEWFLWMTAIGVHAFWIIAWTVQLRDSAHAASWKSHGETRA